MPRTFDKEQIKEALTERAESLFRDAWGEPVKASARQWRAKADDARLMDMQGPDRGQWFDHKSGQGGDLFAFFAVEFCGLSGASHDFPRVLAEAAQWCGIQSGEQFDKAALTARQSARKIAAEAAAETEARDRAATVAELMRCAQGVTGSPAAAYLAGRGIEAKSWPNALAYLPPMKPCKGVLHNDRAALVVWATDDAGKVQGGQRVLILADGSKAPEAQRKPSFGAIAGYPARFPATIEGGPLCIAEGPETALAIWRSTGFEVWAVFGVSGWQTAPAPTGRKVVFCPDRDATDSPAGIAFHKAIEAQAARDVQVWIAEAPEAEGSKRDLADTLQRAGADAVADAIGRARQRQTPRGAGGRFTGLDAIEAEPLPAPRFLSLGDAEQSLTNALTNALEEAAAWDADSGTAAPVVVIRATPGTGKSVGLRRALQGFDLGRLAGDAVFYSPTMALSDEAARDAQGLGLGFHVTRGRSATNPATGETMCARAKEAEALGILGLPVKPNLCKRDNDDGTVSLCPFYAVCAGVEAPRDGEPKPAYLGQWNSLQGGPVLRFEAQAYLNGRGDGSGRAIGLRIVDEKSWTTTLRNADVTPASWQLAELANLKGLPRHIAQKVREGREAQAADRLAVARRVLEALRAGASPVLADVSADDLERFAKDDAATMPTQLNTLPGDTSQSRQSELEALASLEREGRKRAAIWRVLAEAKRAGIEMPERLQWLQDYRGAKGDKDPREVLRVHWMAELPGDVPMILLDADADPVIVNRLHPGARLVDIAVKPCADVVQVSDRVFSKAALIGPENRGNRDAWADVIQAEVLRDNADPRGARGVLAGASKAVVRAMFEDAGLIAPNAPQKVADAVMRGEQLHGARWLWFGPGSLGLNSYKSFGAVVVIGREEMPVDALEDMGRAMFGDGGEPLQMVQPDETGRALMPVQKVPYLMADGSGAAAMVRVHPDLRIAALQFQGREDATRQLLERLRLVRPSDDRPKRVILGSKVPLPDLPVSRLVKFDDLRPSRFERACMAAALGGGVLRLSAAGLAQDAPRVFRTDREAGAWLERDGRTEIKYPRAPNIRSITGAGVLNGVLVSLRVKGQRGRATPALVFGSGDLRAIAQAQLGDLVEFDVIAPDVVEDPAPAAPPRRLVWVSDDCQIKRKPTASATALWLVIAGQPFLMWTRRKGQELAEMLAYQPDIYRDRVAPVQSFA